MMSEKIRTFSDLDVYQRLYKAMITITKEIITKLPIEERFGLADQMRRASKAPLAIIAEGYARKYYPKEWQKYLKDAMGECNEMIVHLSCYRDLYCNSQDIESANNLIKEYDIAGKQIYRLGQSWNNALNKERI